MKKILAILLCAVMALSLVACGTQKEGIPAQNSGVVSSSDESNSTTNMNNVVSNDITNPSDNVLIGTWKCLTYDYLIYTFVNDTDLEVFSIDETIKYSYHLDGNRLTINEGDSSYSFDVQISGDRFSFVLDDVELVFEKDNSVKEEVSSSSSEDKEIVNGDDILAFNNINDSSSESDNETNVGTEEEITEKYSQFVGTWEEDSNFTHRDRITFFEDGTIKREITKSERVDLGENARFDGDYINWKWTSGELSGFGCGFGPITDFDGNSFVIPAANAYEEAMRYIKIQ